MLNTTHITNLTKLKNNGTRTILYLLDKHEGKEGLKKVQLALKNLGKDLEIDGIIGPITIQIIKSINNKLLHKELFNILTNKNVNKNTNNTKKTQNSLSPYINYLKYAYEELGTKEIHGSKHNPRILQYHSVSGGFSTDEVPWCASFINFIMLKAGYKTPRYPARAKSWLNFGKSSGIPIKGSIAIKTRKGGGHTTFVIGQDDTKQYLYCLGGNQHDEVNISKYPKNVFLDFRVPNDFDLSEGILPILSKDELKNIKEAGKES